ncbi:SpoIIE family protein phosphatase [Streptomyces sp. NPDC049954]|uniref:ATP-binding SpoIIE family protein phosphatase n=1 Tax=Streptomyces sp. NPDC049954 TaxID=3155779 RepID=UPI0034476B2E
MSATSAPDDGELFAGVAAAVLDRRGIVTQWSRTAAELLGRPASAVLGRSVLRLFAERPAWARYAAASAPAPGYGTAVLRTARGDVITVRYGNKPFDSSSRRLVLAVPAEQAARSEQGEALVRALLGQKRIGMVLRDTDLVVVGTNIMEETFAGLTLPVGSRLSDVMTKEDSRSAEAALRHVLETGDPLVGDEQRVTSRDGKHGDWSFSVTAVRTTGRDGRPTGVAVLLSDATEHWRAERRRELRHRAAADIGVTLDVFRTAQEVADVLVPAFGDLAWVDLAEAVLAGDEPPRTSGGGDPHLRRTAVRCADGGWPAGLLQPGESVPPFPDRPLVRALQAGRTVVVSREEVEHRLAGTPQLPILTPREGRSVIFAPLFARDLLLGVVGVWRTRQTHAFDQEDADLLTEIAAHASLSVDNARRYRREHRSVVSLQRRLLPQFMTRTRAMETAGSYRPAEEGSEIGGDWFDAIALSSLRTALVVGDVTGHGLHAAATMGRLRTAVQTLADMDLGPDEMLTHLDDLVARLASEAEPEHRDTVGATCLIAVHDPVSSTCAIASAGHLPPLMSLPDSVTTPLAVRPGPPLGVGGQPFETTTVDVPPGSVLALYTDGVFQGSDLDLDDVVGLAERLHALQHQGDDDLTSVGRALMGGEEDHGPRRDDTAVLLARTAALGPDAVAEWEFSAAPEVVARARDAATGQLAAWGLEELSFSHALIVSELVTNAVRHAGGPVRVRLIRDRLLITEVSDPSNTQPRLRRAHSTDEGGRGLFLVAQLSLRWGSRYGATGKTIWVEQELSAD